MSGVLFVVHIPSKELEQKLRDNKNKDAVVSEENEKGKVTFENRRRSISENTTPLTTPEMQRYGTFFKDKESDTMDEMETDSMMSETPSMPKTSETLAPPEEDDTISKRSKSCERLNVIEKDSNMIRKSLEGIKEILSSARKNSRKQLVEPVEEEEEEDRFANELGLSPDAFMVHIMAAILKSKNVRRASWLDTKNGEGHQIIFNIESGGRCDDIIRLLSEWGVGEREGTSVGVLPCTMYYEPIVDPLEEKPHLEKPDDTKDGGWKGLLSSVRARINVANIVHEIKASAAITFDFLCLVIVASILAAFGLVEDSTLFLAASMLISPLMGPIIAATFGTVIKDRSLQVMGVVNEMIGIFLATSVGFIFGVIVCSLDDRYGVGEGLTNEILSRCELHSLLVGVLIALPSGAAVAIAILGENTGSLVGTAISASLLPPAVNAGLLWALSTVYILFEKDGTRYNSVIKTSYYSNHQSIELAIFGCISMCVTLTNVICIYFMGVLFLKIKEVTPVASKGQRQFWKHDIKIARDYNKTLHPNDSYTTALADELAHLKMHDKENLHGIGAELLRPGHNQNTWSPTMHQYHHLFQDKPHMRDLEAIYLSLACPPTTSSNDSCIERFIAANRAGPSKTPPKYKSIPDEEMLTPLRHPSDPIKTPQSSANKNQKNVSSSFPFVSRFIKHENSTGNAKRRFTVLPVEDPDLKPKPN